MHVSCENFALIAHCLLPFRVYIFRFDLGSIQNQPLHCKKQSNAIMDYLEVATRSKVVPGSINFGIKEPLNIKVYRIEPDLPTLLDTI